MRGDERFEVGDVVVLRSGSPRMTVESIAGESGKVTCTWYQDGRREVTTLPVETLVFANDGRRP